MIKFISFLSAFLFSAPAFAQLGVNLNGLSDYSTELPFCSAMKMARCFGSPDKSFDCIYGDKIPDAQAPFGIFVYTDVQGTDGTYSISFSGRADLSGTGKVQNVKYDSASNKSTAEIVMGAQPMSLSFKNISSPISGIEILRPNCQGEFNPAFLESIKFYSALRFMDWLRTNGNPIRSWSERKLTTENMQTGIRGVALEYVTDLANASGKDIWVNVPYLADADYAKQMAQLLKDRLRPEIKIYVEYSNELWNTAPGFTGNQHKDLAIAEVAAGATDLQMGDPADQNVWYWARRRVGKKTVEISKAFRSVFGDAAMGTRVRVILSGHAADQSKLRAALQYINKYSFPVSQQIWGIAIAPYAATMDHLIKDSAGNVTALDPAATIDTIVNGFSKSATSNAAGFTSRRKWDGVSQDVNHREYADYFGVRLVLYESGQHMNQIIGADLVKKAKLDPKFQPAYKNYFMNFFNANPFGMAFQFADISSWKNGNEFGATYDLKTDTPQTLALKEVAAAVNSNVTLPDPKDLQIADLKSQLALLQSQILDLQSQVQNLKNSMTAMKTVSDKLQADLSASQDREAKDKSAIASISAVIANLGGN